MPRAPTGFEHPRAARGRKIASELRAGAVVTDRQFDALYPLAVRDQSSSYWTPVRIARRAAQHLVTRPGVRVLDVGSGAGKFCCVAAASTLGVFQGVEQRAELVQYAREVAGLLDSGLASFTHAAFDALSPRDYDGFYLFNPFEENTDRSLAAADRVASPGDDWFHDDVERARAFLARARTGARVVTYNGIGGALPDGYELAYREKLGCVLEVWVKGA